MEKLLLLTLFIMSCTAQNKNSILIKEIGNWKKELILNGEVGPPCKEDYNQWAEKNPDVYWGLSDTIKNKEFDYNKDGQPDYLLYFHAGDPCNGGNGIGSDFAKIIYSNENNYFSNDKIIKLLEDKININFQQKTKYISQNNRVVIFINDFNETLDGQYILWIENDANCCPSYSGNFKYNLINRELSVNIAKKI